MFIELTGTQNVPFLIRVDQIDCVAPTELGSQVLVLGEKITVQERYDQIIRMIARGRTVIASDDRAHQLNLPETHS